MQEIGNSIAQHCRFLDNQSLLEVCEVFTAIIARLLNEGKFEELYNFYRQYDLTPELLKENIDVILTSQNKSNSLHSVSKSSLSQFSKYYQKKSERKVTKKSRGKKESSEESEREEESEEEESTLKLMDN